MKVLAIPDLHAFPENYSRPSEDGIPSRLADWRRTADALVELAVRERVDLAVAPGDYFTNPKPPARAIIEVATLFRRLEDAYIPVVGCNGNHDLAGPGQAGPVDIIAKLGNPQWGITTPWAALVCPGVQVAVLPWAKPGSLLQNSESASDLVQRTSQALMDIARGFAAQLDPNRPAILIGHWPVAGCVLSSGQSLAGGEPSLPLHELQALPFRLIVMGHIHRPQFWQHLSGSIVLHTGAFQRNDFGEEHDKRGAYIVDIETGVVEWHDLPARRFYTFCLDDDTDVRAWLEGVIGTGDDFAAARDAICRVTYRCTDELHRQVDQAALIRALEEAGAHQVAGVYPEIIKADRARASELTEQTLPLEALDAWLAMRTDLSAELRSEVRQAAESLMEEVTPDAAHADRVA